MVIQNINYFRTTNNSSLQFSMPGWEITIGCVGKPSSGKSTFFNSVTDGNAKVFS